MEKNKLEIGGTRMANLSEVQKLLAEYSTCEVSEITPEKRLIGDLELDSFSLLDAVAACESRFHLSIPDSDLKLLDTVQDVLDYINANIKQGDG
jgi:acyl carrier protein